MNIEQKDNPRNDLIPYSRLVETFKVDPTSPSGLTWLVHGPGVRAGDHAGSMTPQGYYTISKGRHALWAHHVVFELTHGRPCRPGFEIDHKDRDPGNNHPDNLREVTKGQNGFNKLGSNTAWFPKGINMNKRTGQVQAIIYKDGVQYRPGRSFMDHLDQSSEKLNALIEETLEALQELHGEHGCYDSYYCQLPIEAVLGPDEGWP